MFNALSALRRLRLRSLADELEIERLTAERDNGEAKFKTAITDLEKQAGEIAELRDEIAMQATSLASANRRANENEADALAMRRKRQMDRDRRTGRG